MEKQNWKSTAHEKWIYWTGICSETRNAGLNHIKDCINSFGFITDFHLFSDISISLNVSIETNKIASLYKALSIIIHLDDSELYPNDSEMERTIMLSVTFTQNNGDMKVEVPAVPG